MVTFPSFVLQAVFIIFRLCHTFVGSSSGQGAAFLFFLKIVGLKVQNGY